jgi:aminopeptidase C
MIYFLTKNTEKMEYGFVDDKQTRKTEKENKTQTFNKKYMDDDVFDVLVVCACVRADFNFNNNMKINKKKKKLWLHP